MAEQSTAKAKSHPSRRAQRQMPNADMVTIKPSELKEMVHVVTELLAEIEEGNVYGLAFMTIEPGRTVGQYVSSSIASVGVFDAIAGLRLLSRDVENLADSE